MSNNNIEPVPTHAAEQPIYHLDLKNRSVSQSVDRDLAAPENYKFVRTEVVKVVNPGFHPVSFEVHYIPDDGERIFLGTFSLFPSDNPGRFIVPTSGKLKRGGKLELTLVVAADDVGKDDVLQADVNRMLLTND